MAHATFVGLLALLVLAGCPEPADAEVGDPSGGDSAAGTCAPEDCGPTLGMPNWLCDDGVTVAGPGACAATEEGDCAWEIIDCPDTDPAACDPEDCGPAPELEMICPDDQSLVFECGPTDAGCGWSWHCPDAR